jgi:peptidyl-prolyl cis-trans isomerase D
MLNLFRQFTKSRIGLIVVFAFLAIIAVAFAASDITGVSSSVTGSGKVLAEVGGTKITDAEVKDRIDRFIRDAQAQGQQITMADFLQRGGYEFIVDGLISAAATDEFGRDTGMQVSKRLIDGDIASAPAFIGLDGKFDQKAFDGWLAQKRITRAALYDDASRDRYNQWLTTPISTNTVPQGVLLPYASLLLERRTGVVGLIQSIAMDPGPDPDDKALTAYYTSNRARYSVPERRIVRYAVVQPEAVRAANAATEAEIADAYKKAGTRFAASEKRSVRQLILLDQATANRVAGQVKGGQALTAAAAAAGLETANFDGFDKAALVRQTSQAIADAAFGAAQGAVIGPVRSPLGWHVLQVEKIEAIPAKTLDQARAELTTEVSERKTQQALADLRQGIEDGIADGKTFDEAARDAKLAAQRTPALTAAGLNPEDPNYKPDAAVIPMMRAGFAFENTGDEPQVVPAGENGAFALVGLERIVAAAPRPLAQVRDRVKGDYLMDKALQKARAAANGMIAKLEKGVPMEKALAEAGVTKGPPPKPFDFKRQEILGQRMEPYIQMAFSMAPKRAKLVEGPNRIGYYVVYLSGVEEHSAANDPAAQARVQTDISPAISQEYGRQFVNAIRDSLKVKRNDQAIAALKAELASTGSAR